MVCTKETVKSNGLNIWSNHSDAISEVEVDIIAVQGLGAHPFYTWVKRTMIRESSQKKKWRTAMTFKKNKDGHSEENSTEVMWPRDLLSPLFTNARVATYSYESDWRKSGVKTSLRQCAEQLLNVIFQHRQTASQRPLVFIGHSLGGLVIQQALTIAVHQQVFRDVRLSVAGIIFLGAPFQGSDVAVYGKWLAEARGYDSTMLDMLRKDSPLLHAISQDFWHSYSDWDIVCFYESKDAAYGPWKARIVDAQSATFFGKRIMFLSTDHSGLNKFDGLQDENFALLIPEIKRMVKGAHSIVADRFQKEVFETSRLEASSNVPFSQDPLFVDRKDIMTELEAKFSNPVHHQRVALVGLGGMGKSQIAIEYSYRLRKRSPSTWVFWVHASSRTRFESCYNDIADTLKLPGKDDPKVKISQLVYQWLRDEKNGPWLLILDNADDANIFTSTSSTHNQDVDVAHQSMLAYIPQNPNGSVLVTSRNNDAAFRLTNETHAISIGQMSETECLKLLKGKLHTQSLRTDSSDLELVKALDRIPLAINQAAAFISNTKGMNVSKYLKLFVESEDNQASLLDKDAGDLRRDPQVPNTVIKTWQISFTQIRRESPSAADLLSLMSVLHRQGIPESVLCDDSDELAFIDALRVLFGFSLITEESDGDTFEMHRLVQLATKRWLHANGEIVKWNQKALKLISKAFPDGRYENWTQCMRLLSHVEAVLSFDLRDPDDLLTQADVLYKLAWYLDKKGDYRLAQLKCEKSFEIRSRHLNYDHVDLLRSMNLCAALLSFQGKDEEAEQMHRQTLQLQEKVLGSEHPSTLSSMHNLALIFAKRGKYIKAEQMYRQVLQLNEKILGSGHPDTLSSMNNLAIVLMNQKRYDEAEQMHRQTLQLQEKVLGSKHPATLGSMSNLALVLNGQKRYDEAEQLDRQTLKLRKEGLGSKHIETLLSMKNLAITLENQKQYEEAKSLFRETLQLRKKILGSEHSDTLKSIKDLATTFFNQGKYEEAESLHQRTFQLRKKILGSEHSDTLQSMRDLAITIFNQGKYEEAESLHQRTFQLREKILGSEHSDTLQSMRDLATTIFNQGKYEEAESLHQRIFQLREKILGSEHSDTLKSMKDLAESFEYQGKYKEAELLYQRIFQLREKILGSEHSDTLQSMKDLAESFECQGKYEEAESLYQRTFQLKEKTFGSDHSDTLTCTKDLARIFQKQGKYEEAERMFQQIAKLENGKPESESL